MLSVGKLGLEWDAGWSALLPGTELKNLAGRIQTGDELNLSKRLRNVVFVRFSW